jgi:phosphohistidine phosphatase
MELYILRHAIADSGQAGQPDSERALTTEGRQKVKQVLRRAAAAKVQPDLILSSPYRRALGTAQIAAKELEVSEKIIQTRALTPERTPEEVWDEIRSHKESDELMIVGHEPLLSACVAHFLDAPTLLVEMKKGAIAKVTLDRFGAQPRGILRWLLTAKLAGAGLD